MDNVEIRAFLAAALGSDDTRTIDLITERWLKDREDAASEAKDAVYDDARDSWNGGE